MTREKSLSLLVVWIDLRVAPRCQFRDEVYVSTPLRCIHFAFVFQGANIADRLLEVRRVDCERSPRKIQVAEVEVDVIRITEAWRRSCDHVWPGGAAVDQHGDELDDDDDGEDAQKYQSLEKKWKAICSILLLNLLTSVLYDKI